MTIKHQLFSLSERIGLTERIASSEWRRQRLLILCYHGISTLDEHLWNPGLYMPPEMLEERLLWLHRHGYRVLPLSEGVERLYAGTLPARSVSITFDDGARDFATHAVPLLERYEAAATVYLTSYYVGRRLPVFDTSLSYALWKGRESGVDLSPLISHPTRLPVATAVERQSTLAALKASDAVRTGSAEAKHAFLEEVAVRLGVDHEAQQRAQRLYLMTAEEVRALPPRISVELHTHRHRTPRDRDAFEREILENRAIIQSLRPDQPLPTHFCYPSGDYSAAFVEWLAALDVSTATTCIPGLAERRSHPLLLPRFVDTTQQTMLDVAGWASGIAEFIPRRRKYQLDPNRP